MRLIGKIIEGVREYFDGRRKQRLLESFDGLRVAQAHRQAYGKFTKGKASYDVERRMAGWDSIHLSGRDIY